MKEKKVLLIEDDPAIAMTIEISLKSHGYVFVHATTGEEGLEKAKDIPDVILLDLGLPGINGFEVCKKIRQEPKYSHIPILIITATHIEGSREKAMALGANAYITKPFEMKDLVQSIDKYLVSSKKVA